MFEKKDKPEITLFETQEVGLIILYPSGVYYSNQAGGYACLQPFEEGFYAPLHNSAFQLEDELNKYFTGKKWQGWCYQEIDDEDADFIDKLLEKSYTTKFLKVDRTKLKKSFEAWIYVNGTLPNEEYPIISGFESFEGVLVWENSD